MRSTQLAAAAKVGMDAVEALAIDGGAVVETAFAGVATDDVNYGAVFYTVPCERSYPQIGRISKLAEYLLNQISRWL